MKKILFIFILMLVFCFTANAQLRAYTFQYNDEFGGKQKCYLTMKTIVAEWDVQRLSVIFSCNESDAFSSKRNIRPRKYFQMVLEGQDFVNQVTKPIKGSDTGKPLALILSDAAWDIAETFPFIDDYALDENEENLVNTPKSLTQLKATRVDVAFSALPDEKTR